MNKFLIDIQPAKHPDRGVGVKMSNVSLGDNTGWVFIPSVLGDVPDETAYAVALVQSEHMQRMTEEAHQTAYSVSLVRAEFDIRKASMQWAQALAGQAQLEVGTQQVAGMRARRI